MIHASYYQPKVFPFKGTATPTEIDRLQDMTSSATLNRTKIEEIGRDGIVDWRKGIPATSISLRQLEYGSIEFWNQLANVPVDQTKTYFSEFKTSQVDIAGYETDDDGNFLSTIWYPNSKVSGFGISIGDPEALIERSFTLVGEDEITLQDNNKYFIYKTTNPDTGWDSSITLSVDPVVVADPDNSGSYLFKVIRVRGNTTTELIHGTDWSCDGTDLFINGQSYATDTIKYYYSATTYTAGETPFVDNNTDLAGITADAVTIYLVDSSHYLYRLQSVAIDTTLDRFDVKEIGNENVVARGVRDITNSITLGRILDTWSIEEVLRGVPGLDFGKLDIRKFNDELTLLVKIYEDATKTSFKIGYVFTGLAPTTLDGGVPLNDYVTRGVTLEGESGFISNVEENIA